MGIYLVMHPAHNLVPVSVVIASLGGDQLLTTIQALNSGSASPEEILLCLPKDREGRNLELCANNVKIVLCSKSGQVAQRALGFRMAKQEYVMQLDDDVILGHETLMLMYHFLSSSVTPMAVGPVYLNRTDGKAVYPEAYEHLGHWSRWRRWAIHGIKPGESPHGIWAPSGRNFGVVRKATPNIPTHLPVQWIPGGCVLHRKRDLITEDFYQWPGKAFAEDLIHSHLLRERGVALYVCLDASCKIDPLPDGPLEPDYYWGTARVLSFLRTTNRLRRFRSWLYLQSLRLRARIATVRINRRIR